MRRTTLCGLLLLSIACVVADLQSQESTQSLGELARRERDRKKALSQEATQTATSKEEASPGKVEEAADWYLGTIHWLEWHCHWHLKRYCSLDELAEGIEAKPGKFIGFLKEKDPRRDPNYEYRVTIRQDEDRVEISAIPRRPGLAGFFYDGRETHYNPNGPASSANKVPPGHIMGMHYGLVRELPETSSAESPSPEKAKPEPVLELFHDDAVNSVAFSPDGRWLASGSRPKNLTIWDAKTGKQVRNLTGHPYPVWSVAFSADGKKLASGSSREIKLWNATTGAELRNLTGHTRSVSKIAFSPNGRWLASASEDQTVKIWDVATGREVRTLRGHNSSVWTVAFSPDSRRVASGSLDETIRIWDVATGSEVRTLTGHKGHVYSLAFSPDGNWLASGSMDRTVKLWDVTTWREARSMAHSDFVFAIAFSPDGNLLAAGGRDNLIRLWEARTGRERCTLAGHAGTVMSVTFSPDGKWLASAQDKTVRIWEVAACH